MAIDCCARTGGIYGIQFKSKYKAENFYWNIINNCNVYDVRYLCFFSIIAFKKTTR